MQHTSTGKTRMRMADDAHSESPASPNGIAIAPPSYGVGVADNAPTQAMLLPAQVHPVQQHGPIQMKAGAPAGSNAEAQPANRTGMPAVLKSGIERLSGFAMDDVRVHYNSAKPAALRALAYTQGSEIHIAPGQERHLPHEAWHVVQQKQGRVRPTLHMQGMAINDDPALENDATRLGAHAFEQQAYGHLSYQRRSAPHAVIQAMIMATSFAALLKEQHDREESLSREVLGQPAAKEDRAASKLEKDPEALPAKALPAEDQAASKIEKDPEALPAKALPAKALSAQEGPYTTVGFEHEFATMGGDHPFQGVPHVELAASEERFNRVPFMLETDAASALELVSPPFLIHTKSKDRPEPLATDVKKVDDLIKGRLEELITPEQTIGKFVNALAENPKLHFQLHDVLIQAKNLSDVTKINYTKDNNKVFAGQIENIPLKKIDKYQHNTIDTQVNLATDVWTYLQIESMGIPNEGQYEKMTSHEKQFYDLHYHLLETMESIPNIEKTPSIIHFMNFFARTLAGQLAVPSMERIRDQQAKMYASEEHSKSLRTGSTDKDQVARGEFHYDAYTTSKVKDVRDVWFKDNIINFGISLLGPFEWSSIYKMIKSGIIQEFIKAHKFPDYMFRVQAHEPSKASRNARLEHFEKAKREMVLAVTQLQGAIEHFNLASLPRKADFVEPKERANFMEHNRLFVGPRQDTHINPSKIQLPSLWPKKRLHVIELRGDPIKMLEQLNQLSDQGRISEPSAQQAEFNQKKLQIHQILLGGISTPGAITYFLSLLTADNCPDVTVVQDVFKKRWDAIMKLESNFANIKNVINGLTKSNPPIMAIVNEKLYAELTKMLTW